MVPRHHELQRGQPVNIVLKPDQRSGKLTPGLVQDILTRGDHPHGVKVRLSNGQIGRVQSLPLSSSSAPLSNFGPASSSHPLQPNLPKQQRAHGALSEPQEAATDYCSNTTRSTSLMDYAKPNKSCWSADQEASMTRQANLENKFPELDPSLIAAILADYSTGEAAESVLSALCTT